jgi:hypothetical protein
MAGKTSRRIQLGKETAAGTAVAATAIWRGLGTIEDQTQVVFVDEDVGYLSGTDRSYIPRVQAALEMEEIEATFEQLPYILEGGVKLVQTGATDTGGSGKVYTYPFPTTQSRTIRTFTIEGGDEQQAEKMQYSFVESFRLSGRAGEAVKVSATWLGRQVTPTTFTSGLSLAAVENILFANTVLFIDPVTTMGATTKSATLLGFELDAKTGWAPMYTADGNIYFGTAVPGPCDITMTLTFLHNGNSVAEKAAWKALTPRNIRLNITGSALQTAGTFANKTLRIDATGRWEKFDKLGEQDGNDIVTGTFRVKYNETAAHTCTITVVNEVASLP